MEKKSSMSRVERLHREKVTRYSIRKYSFGAASVAVAALFMFLGNGAVSANELSKQETSLEATTPTLDKTQLESYISEIETKLSNGSYDNKTEESVTVLKADLEAAKATLANATTQAELKIAYNKLVTTANTKLKTKPVEKKETPAVDTTEGKETVGKKAENTEPKSESNSIEHTGSNDPRNGKEMDKENAFRTEATSETPSNEKTTIANNISYTIAFSDVAKKEIYLYNEEDTDINITVDSTTGKKITAATVKKGSGQYLDGRNISSPIKPVETDDFGWSYHSITDPTTGPVTVSVTGKPNDTFKTNPKVGYTKKEDQNSVLGDRYLHIVDEAGNTISGGSNSSNPGYFKLVVKSQTYKYSIKLPKSNADKIAVSNIDSLTEADIAKIKNQINIQYSDKATTQDARLASHKGEVLADKNTVVAENGITVENGTVTVTYKDGSVDTTPVADVARTNEPPTVEFPYSDAAKREIYVYGAEENSFDIKIKDDANKIAAATVLQGGNNKFNPVEGEADKINTQYGYTANEFKTETPASEATPAVIRYSGTPKAVDGITPTSLAEATKGENPPGMVLGWRYVRVTDTEGTDFTGSGTGVANDHGFRVMLKPQTQKYDVTTPAEESAKFPVVDANNVTDAEFKKLVGENNANIKLHYSAKNTDANLVSKRNENVDDKDTKIKSVTKVDNNMVVTYNDGSTDTLPLTDFARTNVAPTVSIPYSVDGKKDIYVYANEDIDVDLKFTDDSGKIKSATILQGGNNALNPVDEANPNVINNEYGTTFTQIDGETGTTATETTPAIVKITGKMTKETPGLTASRFPTDENGEYRIVTRYATSTDMDGGKIANGANGNSYAKDPGAFTLVLKSQAKRYEISDVAEADKVAVADPAAVTDDEFNSIKEKVKIEFSKTNEDKNLESKRGQEVIDKDSKIDTITKDGNNLVVTYKDGSKDVRPLTDFTKLDKQPAIDAVNTAATEKIAAINATPNATDEEKAAAIAKVNADKTAALTAINDTTTKTALDTAKNAGTSAIAADNPVVAKKDAAKADVEAARKAKEDAIKADTNLSEAEKTAAIAKNNTAAAEATKAIDSATTNDAVDQAKTAGTGEIAKVNPVGKELAKEAVTNALADKEKAIEARTDLTPAEKKAAKDKAKELADAQLAKIAEQPSFTDTPAEATTAQTAVNNAEDKGIADVTAVNPVAKEAAKKDIADQLATKNGEIDDRDDLTDEEKATAKAEAKKLADAQLDEIAKQPDNVDDPKALPAAQTAVNDAKDKGVADVKAVNPVAKEAAKKAIADELAEKEKAIDGRTDLTDEEKAAAKKDAQDKAKEATDAIDAQPSNAATPEAAEKAQTAVNGAKDKGVADVKAVDPAAAKKPAAKKAVEDALKAKVDAIDARTDLTDDEKKAAKDAAKDAADKAKEAIDAATDDAALDKAKEAGTGEIAKVNPVAKEAAKKAVADELAKKEAEIAGRNDLTDEEKAKAKEEAQAKAKEATDAIDAQPSNAETPEKAAEAQTAVDGAKDKGVADVKAVDPEAKAKPAAKKAIEDKLAKQLEDIANTPDATDDEKKVAADAAKALAEGAKKEIDKAGTDAEVKQLQEEAEGEIEKSVPVVEDKPNARKAIEDEAKAKKEAIDARTDLTPKAKEDLKAQVDAIADQAKKSVDAAKTSEAVDGIEESDKAAIKAVGEVNIPADKVLVNNPSALTDDEKAKVLEAVKKVNPDAKEITQDADGNVTVTTPDGHKEIITPEQVVKTAATANDPKAGNDIVKPADKVVVNDPAKLTDAEKEKIKAAVEAVNPNSIVVVDDKGNAKVSTPDGQTQVIPVEELVRTVEDTKKPNAGNDIVKPADKTAVKDPANLTPEEKKAIEDKVKAVNPGATVVVDDKGNATVTTPEGKTAVIPATDLTKSPADAAKANAGNTVNTPAAKVEVKDPAKLTDEEKAKVKKAVEDVNPGSKVVVDDKGNTTVTTSEGKTATIPAADVTKSAADAGKANAGNAVNTPAAKVEVKDPANLTDAEKKAIEDKVKAVNPGSKVVVDDKGNVTVTTPEGKTATIPAADVTKSAADAGKANAGNGANTPATKTVVKDPAKLTDEEKAKVKKAVEDVNPGSTVVVNDKGDVIVTKGDGTVLVIPELDLVIPEDKLTDPTQQNGVNTPATRVLVGDKAKLTADEIEKVKESIKAVNPGSTVVVDDKGNATVTTPEGKTATIPAAQLVKDAKDVAAKNNGENINVDFEKETVADFNNLTDAEKEAAKAKIKGANADVVEVIFDKAGNATVITKDGKVYTIVAKDIFKQRPYVPSNGGGNNSGNGNGTSGNNGATNTDAKVDKAKLEGAIRQLDELIVKESAKLDAETAKEANALLADAKKVFANADASQAEVDAMVKRIEGFMAKVASSTDHATPANDQAAQTPAVDTATTQAASAQANARKAAKELPNTGTADSTVAMVAAAASALLGLGLAGRRRKDDEEA